MVINSLSHTPPQYPTTLAGWQQGVEALVSAFPYSRRRKWGQARIFRSLIFRTKP